jgi:cyclic pyranopterin phosphate synthase
MTGVTNASSLGRCAKNNKGKMKELTHITEKGKINMVDVSGKPEEIRTAEATGHISLGPETMSLIRDSRSPKGDVLTVAELAGIMGGKKTSELIPLCHPLQITKMDVIISLDKTGVRVNTLARCIGPTGVEMEALTAASVALLTVYDMCKAVDKGMIIDEIKLVRKTKQGRD